MRVIFSLYRDSHRAHVEIANLRMGSHTFWSFTCQTFCATEFHRYLHIYLLSQRSQYGHHTVHCQRQGNPFINASIKNMNDIGSTIFMIVKKICFILILRTTKWHLMCLRHQMWLVISIQITNTRAMFVTHFCNVDFKQLTSFQLLSGFCESTEPIVHFSFKQ